MGSSVQTETLQRQNSKSRVYNNSQPTNTRYQNLQHIKLQLKFSFKTKSVGLKQHKTLTSEFQGLENGVALFYTIRAHAQKYSQNIELTILNKLANCKFDSTINPGVLQVIQYFQLINPLLKELELHGLTIPFDKLVENLKTAWYIIYYGTCPVYWNTHLCEFGVALSTAEAEYQAACSCAKNIMALRNILNELTISNKTILNEPILIYEDNESTIKIVLQNCSKNRTRYILTKVHYIRELQQNGTILLKHISTNFQTADALTKALPGPLFNQHKQYLMGNKTNQYEINYPQTWEV